MRPNIVSDDNRWEKVPHVTGLKSKRAAVELGLRSCLKLRGQEAIRRFCGTLNWEGSLDAIRTD